MTGGERQHAWSGAALKAARKDIGLSQAQVADLAGLSRNVYNALENGRRSLTLANAERIAPHLRKNPRDLLQPETPAGETQDPYTLLRELATSVRDQQTTIEGLEAKLEALGRASSRRRRAGGDQQ